MFQIKQLIQIWHVWPKSLLNELLLNPWWNYSNFKHRLDKLLI